VVAAHPKLTVDRGQASAGGLAVASAHSRRSDAEGRPFWATVNVCDTKDSPNALGIRTSVPGNGSGQRIFARYTAQWWSEADQQWLTVAGSGVTPWVPVGSADVTSRQAGWTFAFVQPPAGTTYVMRGVVELQWRDTAAAARQVRRSRTAGKRHAARSSAHRRRSHGHRKARRAERNTVVQRRVLLTKTGMKGVQGGDPPGLSKAMCLIW
jgi:hypothetical protein